MIRGETRRTTGLRDWMTPLLLSLYLVPLPGLGAHGIPFILVLWLLTDPRLCIRVVEVLIYFGLVAMGFLMILIQPDKFSFLISLMLVVLISRLLEILPRDWSLIPALWLHLGAAMVSLMTLVALGYDLAPMTLYGESRHAIHQNAFLTFRISGLYLEPSTMGLHMLLMSIWANHSHPDKRWVAMLYSGMSLVTFSSVTILAAFKIAHDLLLRLRSKAGILLIPVVILGSGMVLQPFYLFFTDKLALYNADGLENAKRFEALVFTLDMIGLGEFNLFLGHKVEVIQRYVFYDLGPVISTPMILGLGGVLLILVFLARMRWSLLNIAIVMATKATINNPLLWVATSRRRKLRTSAASTPPDGA